MSEPQNLSPPDCTDIHPSGRIRLCNFQVPQQVEMDFVPELLDGRPWLSEDAVNPQISEEHAAKSPSN